MPCTRASERRAIGGGGIAAPEPELAPDRGRRRRARAATTIPLVTVAAVESGSGDAARWRRLERQRTR